jgi:hypothetical protein
LASHLHKTVQEILDGMDYEEFLGWQIYLNEIEPTTNELIDYAQANIASTILNAFAGEKICERNDAIILLAHKPDDDSDDSWVNTLMLAARGGAKQK